MKKLSTRALTSLALVLFVSVVAFTQRTISGTVADSDGEPLIGANVLEKGTLNGTITDIDGSYSLEVADGATLLFSFTGFVVQEITIGSSNVADVALAAGTFLEEIVVTGYGTQKIKEVTGSIASVKEDDFNKGAVHDVATLIQGKVAGLNITQVGGDPNATPEIRLRGVTTFGANSAPLIVIDGVIGGSLDLIDPNDIASIDVLKDGSASAIYGTRGSSGVILVTTKKGVAGKTTINYNTYMEMNGALNLYLTQRRKYFQFQRVNLMQIRICSKTQDIKLMLV